MEAGNVPPERGGTCSNWGTRGLLMASAAPALGQLGVVLSKFSKSFSFQLRLWHSAAKSTEQCVILIKPNDMNSIGVEGGHNPLKWLSVWHRPIFKWGVCAVIKESKQKMVFLRNIS